MKFNRAKHVEQTIKKALLEEAIAQTDLIKKANLEKSAMSTYRDQKDLGDLINRKFEHTVPSGRIEKIAADICNQFKSFLRSRLKPKDGGDNRLYMKVPVISSAEPLEQAFIIPNIPIQDIPDFKPTSNQQRATKTTPVQSFMDMAQAGSEKAKQQGLQIQQPNQAADLKNIVPEGCIYYRYAYSRSILPNEQTGKEERTKALTNLSMLQQTLHTVGVEFDPESFIQDVESLGIALMPGFDTTDDNGVTGSMVENFVLQEAPQAAARLRAKQGKPGDKALLDLYRYLQRHKEVDPNTKRNAGAPAGAFGLGRRHEVFLYDCTPPTGQRVFSAHIAMLRSESALARMVEAKISCGYCLDKRGLINTIYRYIYASAKNQERAVVRFNGEVKSKRVTEHTLKTLARQWQQELPHMLSVYESIEQSVISKESKFKFAKQETSSNAYGLSWSGGQKYRRLVPPQVQGKAISWNYIHFQMLLQNITKRNPQLRREKVEIGKYSFFDPSRSLKHYSDGLSQRTGIVTQAGKRAVILPPLVGPKRTKKRKENLPGDPQSEQELGANEVAEDQTPTIEDPKAVARLETDQINLGLRHLKYNGTGVMQLLRKYGKTAAVVLSVIKSPAFQGLFPESDDQENSANIVLREYPKAYMGSECLAKMIDDITQSGDPTTELIKRMGEIGISSGSDNAPRMFDTQYFPALQKYGYAIAKLMEIIHGLIHASDESNFEYINTSNGQRTNYKMYGQSYSTSSGVGQGGELLLSVRYAYKAKLDEYAGNQAQAIKIIKDEYDKRGHELRIPANMSPASETQFPQKGNLDPGLTTRDDEQLSQPKPGCTFVSNFEFFLGQSSKAPGAEGDSMFNTVFVDKDWNQCVAKLRQMYSNRDKNIDELSEDFIWDINADLDHLETCVQQALTNARNEIANISLTITNRNHDFEHIEAEEMPSGALTDQTAQETAEKAKQAPQRPVENVPQDEIESPATSRTPVPESARTVPAVFPELKTVLSKDPNQVTAQELLSALPKPALINEQIEKDVTDFLVKKYNQLTIDDLYGELLDKYQTPSKIVPALLKTLLRMERQEAQDRARVETNKPRPGIAQPTTPPATPAPAPAPAPVQPPEKVETAPPKSMFKRIDPHGKIMHASIQERLATLANTFDSKGLTRLAGKLDIVLSNLTRMG